jgi:predicted permease
VIGRKLTVGAVVVEIVGVMPPGFVGDTPSQPADLWLPLELFGAVSNWGSWNERGNTWFDVMGRLRPGVRPEQAQAELTGVLRNCVRTDLEEWRSSGSTVRSTPEMFRVELAAGSGGFNELRRRYDKALWLLSGAVALLLLLACLNVAGLLLARGVARSREMGVRLALGASRARVMRQLLLESLLLCAGGAVIGLAIANWFAGYFVTMVSRVTQPLDVPYRLNGTVLGFTLAVTALAALVSGFLPAWQTTRSHLSAQLSAAARSVTQHRSRLVWNRGLVAAQVALGVLLACGAGLMLRSLHTLTSRDVGYRVDGLAVAFLEPAPRKESTDLRFHFEQQSARIEQFRQRLLALPGVQSAALAHMSPMSGWMMSATMNTPSGGTGRIMAMQNYVSLGYFETLDTKLKAGRWFHSSDRGAGRRVCVIDEDLARALFADRSPLGQRISSGQKYDAENSMEVIGVARPNKWYGPKQSGLPFKGMVWTTLEQSKRPFLVVMARTAGDATGLAPALKTVFREEMPEMLVTATTTMEELRDATLQQERMMTVLLSLFGVVALVIVFAGQHGLLAYTVERGATARDLLSMVGKESLLLIGAGLLVGLPAAAGLSRLLTAYLFEVKPTDPWSYGLTAALVGAIGVLAAVRPARRAASVEAASALRGE